MELTFQSRYDDAQRHTERAEYKGKAKKQYRTCGCGEQMNS